MLDTIKINTNRIQIIKQINVQDVYGTVYSVPPFRYPQMGLKEKRFISPKRLIGKTGKYYPSVTFRIDGKVYIEFSAPKILFENNVEELSDDDAQAFAKALSLKLYDMGLNVSERDLWASNVSFCTVSKNVIIDDVGATEFIEFTRRLWWKWRHSTKLENYEQNGIAIREFTSTTGIGIYAKVPSLSSIKTMTDREKELASKLVDNNILRFEYRMQNYQRTKAKYAWALGYTLDDVKLRDIFSSELSKKILMYDLNKSLFSDEFKLISIQMPTIRKMYEFLMDKDLNPHEEWAVIAFWRLCSDLGVNRAKETFDSRYSESTTKRVSNLCEQVFKAYTSYEYPTIRLQIEKRLNSFKSFNRGVLDEWVKSVDKAGVQSSFL